jgi:hypothetical protein
MHLPKVELLLLATFVGLTGCRDAPFEGTRCANGQTVETCACHYEYDECRCDRLDCDPGVCVAVPGGATCALEISPAPECVSVKTGTACRDGQLYACDVGYLNPKPISCDGVCVVAGDTAMCAASEQPWPGCDPSLPRQAFCDGNTTGIECVYGYRRGASMDYSDSACGTMDGWHCTDNGVATACVPDRAVVAAVCQSDDMSVKRCMGTTLVTCVIGQVVQNMRCKACDNGVCTGSLQQACEVDADCAPGFQCILANGYRRECTAACSGPELDNPQCLAIEVDTALPYDSIFGKCTSGYCRF